MGRVRDRWIAFKQRHGRGWVVVLIALLALNVLRVAQDIEFVTAHRKGLVRGAAEVANIIFGKWFLPIVFLLVTLWVVWLYSKPIDRIDTDTEREGGIERTTSTRWRRGKLIDKTRGVKVTVEHPADSVADAPPATIVTDQSPPRLNVTVEDVRSNPVGGIPRRRWVLGRVKITNRSRRDRVNLDADLHIPVRGPGFGLVRGGFPARAESEPLGDESSFLKCPIRIDPQDTVHGYVWFEIGDGDIINFKFPDPTTTLLVDDRVPKLQLHDRLCGATYRPVEVPTSPEGVALGLSHEPTDNPTPEQTMRERRRIGSMYRAARMA